MENVTFANPGAVPAGSLALPAGATPAPGVVMVGGSGPSDRYNGTHFPPIRVSESPRTAFTDHAAEVDEPLWSLLKRNQDRDPRAPLTVEVFPNADHRLRVNGADPALGYLNTLTRWITDRTTSPS